MISQIITTKITTIILLSFLFSLVSLGQNLPLEKTLPSNENNGETLNLNNYVWYLSQLVYEGQLSVNTGNER
jgi:hypothetical protein